MTPPRLRAAAATAALAAALVLPLLPPTSATATGPLAGSLVDTPTRGEQAELLSAAGRRLLTVDFDGQDATVVRGAQLTVSGRVATVAQTAGSRVARADEGVPASFTVAVTGPDGAVLATQDVTAADDGSFSTTVPASVTRDLPGTDETVLGVRALDATYDGFSAEDAGATAVEVLPRATRLRLENSFVSSVGWVKPGERYPSRVIVRNPGRAAVAGGTVTVRAPRGTTFRAAAGPGSRTLRATTITWRPGRVPARGSRTLVLEARAATTKQLPTVVWRDLSTTARLAGPGGSGTAVSHGPKVIPPAESYDTARYGDRPFPVVPVQYVDRTYAAGHSGQALERVINSPRLAGSTFNLFQEMSLGQLFPHGTVPSAGIATADFDYAPGFPFTRTDPATLSTCTGVTFADLPLDVVGSPLYPERITDGVYNLPGTTQYYGADGNGSAVIGSLTGVAALQQIDSGCGPTGKIVADAVALADPEIDYSDFDTDKDGVVDFFMGVFAGCGGNGASQLAACSEAPSDALPYDNIWPHSSSLEYYLTDPETGLAGFTTDDQLRDLEGRPLYWRDGRYDAMTTKKTPRKVFVRVGPYNLNPETALDKASVISHEYGHSLGLPDFYSTGGRETYGDWNLMATDKSQHMDAFARQELGWVVPRLLPRGRTTVRGFTDSKQDVGAIHWRTPQGRPYVLRQGRDGRVHNSLMYVAKLPGRQLLSPRKFGTGVGATKKHAWFSGAGNDFGCASDGGGRNLDLSIPALSKLPEGSTVTLTFKSLFDIEWDYDHGFVLTSTDGGKSFTSNESEREVPTTTTGNPNQNGCQATYSNGITGSSASYTDPLTVATDRALGNTPPSVFIADRFDVSELAGARTPVLRFSYATDPGLARPGWFIDDVRVTATTPSGEKVLFRTDFESSGGPRDPHVFNGGCRPDGPGGDCTKGWQYVKAGAEADFDHAYYLEMRDRSGFDLAGRGQVDRDPISFRPGLYLAYTDEAHGYGNAGTDDPPAQTPIDAVPEPGSATPDLSDAAFIAAKGRSSYSDSGVGHTDNYTDPSQTLEDPRYAGVANPWRFRYRCLSFDVLSMRGGGIGPVRADGDLTGTVRFRIGGGCGRFDWGY
ncbi:immune inhibitor A [Nocardioides sp. SOB77]|uniref:Immune inhibitor A n=1 Tax=Nocardioides oceani TaxID=3058369 RepID=A0ABT8FC83_9ACTN|nr:immune inhibitor A domain-containing protein [Nocardioides oceani]MDN4172297.1 immune inhibitor A [Nocardioides oceani]